MVLLEEQASAVVPDGPFLLERLEAQRPVGDGGPVLAVGGVLYGRRPEPAADRPAGVAPPAELGNRPRGFFAPLSPSAPPARLVPAFAAPRPGEFFEPLPRSGPTARQVLALAAPRPALPLLSGAAASTDRLIVELPRAGWALLYTHGYFDEKGLEEQKRRIADQLKAWRLQPGRTAEPMGLGSLSPLAYNGLALTGANLPSGELPDSGILSAEVIAGLPMDGLRLAVLTESGGMSGLVHAFHLAGCPDVVATLWNVDDDAAAAVIKLFFQGVWRKGLGPLAALRRAQLLAYRNPGRIAELAGLEGEAFEMAVAEVEGAGVGGDPAARAAGQEVGRLLPLRCRAR